uniref:Uncharacterized protein n=1 Tax=Triticum urartu TaxID=4572 RepID=A0A8R7V9S8_TRIUA
MDPTLLKISGSELIEVFQEFGIFTRKTYECIRRMLDENEHGWYGEQERRRWRKILPKEWVVSLQIKNGTELLLIADIQEMVLERGDYINSKKMRQMFAGGQCDYALDTCQLIWAIHETVEGYCIMYAFDMDLEILHVFDPKRTCAGIRILERLHHDTCEILLDGLVRSVDAYFVGRE